MARARTPVAVAKATGAAAKNPQRHRGRAAPAGVAMLGAPSAYLEAHEREAFKRFKKELPWLKESHRLLVELGARLRGCLMHPDLEKRGLSLQGSQELRRICAQLGATPADESKVNHGDGGDQDPDDGYFAPPPSIGAGKPH